MIFKDSFWPTLLHPALKKFAAKTLMTKMLNLCISSFNPYFANYLFPLTFLLSLPATTPPLSHTALMKQQLAAPLSVTDLKSSTGLRS